MKTISISGSARKNVGKRDAKELRYEGKVPCVLYGGTSQTHFAVLEADLKGLVYSPEVFFVDLTIDGKATKAIMQDIQFHPVTDVINHVDFLELNDNKEVKMNIPIKLTGTSPGVKAGGKLVQKLRKLKVKALPKNFTDNIELSIETLEVGKNLRVSDIAASNLTILNAKSDTIVSVVSSRALKEAEAAAKK